jgi:hypothetical protein
MGWSYSGDPAASALDEVRFLIQDTDETNPLFEDPEITYAVNLITPVYGSNLMVAAYLCDVLSSAYAGEASISADGVTISTDGLGEKYKTMGARFRALHNELDGMGGGPQAGGIDRFEWPDWSQKPKVFGLNGLDNWRAGQQNYGGQGGWHGVSDAPTSDGWWGP